MIFIIVTLLIIVFAVLKAVVQVEQGEVAIVERFGVFRGAKGTLMPGLHILVPFADTIRQRVDTREQTLAFLPQTMITAENASVSIDIVIYYQVVDPVLVTYGHAQPLIAIEKLASTTMRNIIGSMTVEEALTGRDAINAELSGALEQATGKWGIRVRRVEISSIDPPADLRASMEKEMKAERDRRARVKEAEGIKQADILTAEGEKQAKILQAEADKEAAILQAQADKEASILRANGEAESAKIKAEGESSAILQVFDAIHKGNVDPKVLSYEYIKTLPQIADSQSSKLWIVPTELTSALDAVKSGLAGFADDNNSRFSNA
ncbi:MAG: SPFH/Band 7/PHB domain protein [Actinomycetaceae bacterium]|nr:SPFH/Band 7/PHB domain protein [Actinomycetaceae bacterium]